MIIRLDGIEIDGEYLPVPIFNQLWEESLIKEKDRVDGGDYEEC